MLLLALLLVLPALLLALPLTLRLVLLLVLLPALRLVLLPAPLLGLRAPEPVAPLSLRAQYPSTKFKDFTTNLKNK